MPILGGPPLMAWPEHGHILRWAQENVLQVQDISSSPANPLSKGLPHNLHPLGIFSVPSKRENTLPPSDLTIIQMPV